MLIIYINPTVMEGLVTPIVTSFIFSIIEDITQILLLQTKGIDSKPLRFCKMNQFLPLNVDIYI